jgi:predicted component of type VI protein secretion system
LSEPATHLPGVIAAEPSELPNFAEEVLEYLVPFLPLIGALFGWGLSELSQERRAKQEERKALARALAELLEIRNVVVNLPALFAKLKDSIEIPAHDWTQASAIIEDILPPSDAIHKRFDAAVDVLAGYSPALAYMLRSKDRVIPLLSFLRSVSSSEELKRAWPDFEQMLSKDIEGNLNEACRDIARRLGRKVRADVEKILNRKPEADPSFQKFVDGTSTAMGREKVAQLEAQLRVTQSMLNDALAARAEHNSRAHDDG